MSNGSRWLTAENERRLRELWRSRPRLRPVGVTEAEIHEMFFGIPKQYRADAVWFFVGPPAAWRKFRRWLRDQA